MNTIAQTESRASGAWEVLRAWWIWVWLAALLVAAVSLVGQPWSAPYPQRFSAVEWTPAVAGDTAPSASAEWRAIDSMDTLGRAVWVRAKVNLSAEEAARPSAALILSGLYSARAELNGVAIGGKGEPGFDAASEAPGPIDAALPIRAAIRAGENDLLLLISTHNAHYRPGDVIHAVDIALNGAAPRRPLQHYAIAMAQAGVLLAMALALLVAGATRKNGAPLLWAGAAAALLLVAMGGEMLRALWSYPYSLHIARMIAVWLAMSAFAGASFAAVSARWSNTLPWRTLLVAGAAIALRMGTSTGWDAWSIASLIGFGSASLWVLWPAAKRGDAGARALSGVLVAVIALAFARPIDLLDNLIYVLGVLAMLPFVWELRATPAPAIASPAPGAKLECEDGAVACADIVSIRAAGNYLEVKRTDGGLVLLRGSLSRLAEAHAPLLRVHRSHAVNLDFAERVVALTGSRYEIVLRDGTRIPASRREAAVLRERISNRATS